MPAYIYYKGQYHILANQKIAKDGQWLNLKDRDKIIIKGKSYRLGYGSIDSPIPDEQEMPVITHYQELSEPTGTKWYITPTGAGKRDGTSWANSRSGAELHGTLLDAKASQGHIYLQEGDYDPVRTIIPPAGVNIYGGFPAENPTWANRDAFAHPTKFIGDGTYLAIDGTKATSGQLVDGLTLAGFSDSMKNGKAKLRNAIVTVPSTNLLNADHCVFIGVLATIGTATDCNLIDGDVQINTATRCYVKNKSDAKHECTMENANHSTAVNCTDSSSYIFGDSASSCTAVNCTSRSSGSISYSYVFGNSASSCTAVNCTSSFSGFNSGSYSYSCIFKGPAQNCTAVNCTSSFSGSGSYSYSYIFKGPDAQNCTAVNCTSSNSSFYSTSVSYIFGERAQNCTAVNCISSFDYDSYIFGENAHNCLSWCNQSGREFNGSYACAGSDQNGSYAIVLGTDNSIARFVNTGLWPAKGPQDVGECPNPVTDKDRYDDWLAGFGDWHPRKDSYLVGLGAKNSEITTDADGVARPDPPTIGSYEPRPSA